jgi:hypothetical protein
MRLPVRILRVCSSVRPPGWLRALSRGWGPWSPVPPSSTTLRRGPAGRWKSQIFSPAMGMNCNRPIGTLAWLFTVFFFLRGFTLDELKAAGISKGMAQTIGIAVDFRRRCNALHMLSNYVVFNILNSTSFPVHLFVSEQMWQMSLRYTVQLSGVSFMHLIHLYCRSFCT